MDAKTASEQPAARLVPASPRPRLDVVKNGAGAPLADPQFRPDAIELSATWPSEKEFNRTLELVDRACRELRASEERVRVLEAQRDHILQCAQAKFQEAQAIIQLAEERAARAEQRANALEESLASAEARASCAEQRSDMLEDWLVRIQLAVEQLGIAESPQAWPDLIRQP